MSHNFTELLHKSHSCLYLLYVSLINFMNRSLTSRSNTNHESRSRSYGVWRSLVLWLDTNVSEGYAASIFKVK